MTSRQGMLIVVADDFGADSRVNMAIAEGVRQGLVSNVSLLANGAAFAEACALARDRGWAGRVGIHISVTEGPALSDPIRHCPRLCDEAGHLRFRRFTHFSLTPEERAALTREWQAQIDRCRSAGIPLGHADSHHHCHTEFPLFRVVAPLLRANHIPFLRLSDNVRKTSLARGLYKRLFNIALTRARLRGTDYFCDADGIRRIAGATDKVIELMVHPILDEQGRLIDGTSGRLLRDCPPDGFRLGSFADLNS